MKLSSRNTDLVHESEKRNDSAVGRTPSQSGGPLSLGAVTRPVPVTFRCRHTSPPHRAPSTRRPAQTGVTPQCRGRAPRPLVPPPPEPRGVPAGATRAFDPRTPARGMHQVSNERRREGLMFSREHSFTRFMFKRTGIAPN